MDEDDPGESFLAKFLAQDGEEEKFNLEFKKLFSAWHRLFGKGNFGVAVQILQGDNRLDDRGFLNKDNFTLEQWRDWWLIFGATKSSLLKKTKHHIIPRKARDRPVPKDKHNLAHKANLLHNAWHILFENIVPDKVIGFLQSCSEIECWKKISRYPKGLRSWLLVFGDISPREAVAIVWNEWMFPSELEKTCGSDSSDVNNQPAV